MGNNDGNLDMENLTNIPDSLKMSPVNLPDLGKPINVDELGEVLKYASTIRPQVWMVSHLNS